MGGGSKKEGGGEDRQHGPPVTTRSCGQRKTTPNLPVSLRATLPPHTRALVDASSASNSCDAMNVPYAWPKVPGGSSRSARGSKSADEISGRAASISRPEGDARSDSRSLSSATRPVTSPSLATSSARRGSASAREADVHAMASRESDDVRTNPG